MNDRYCLCGTRLDRSSAVRSLKSPCLRMFMSIRTLKSLTSDTKICNVCRLQYKRWKDQNSEFGTILNRLDSDLNDDNDFDNNSSDSMDIRNDDRSSSQAVRTDEGSHQVIENVVKILFNSTSSSHHTCCVCPEKLINGSAVVASEDRDMIFFTRNIWIPKGTRCCPTHVVNHRLKTETINLIKPSTILYDELNASDVQLLLSKSQKLFENRNRRFNFDDPEDLTDDEYRLLTSLSLNYFNEFVKTISSSSIRNTSSRSIRTAVGIYLCKLRLGLSNRLLACMFQLSDKNRVSQVIKSARGAILKSFVPYNLGFGHITRQDVIDHHTTTIAHLQAATTGFDLA